MGLAIVVADTSVIINFLRIDRMDLIGAHPDSFISTDHVGAEIADAYPDQQARYQAALDRGHITQHVVDEPAELELFLRLAEKGRLGAGERSAIALALNRKCALAIDDTRAIRRTVEEAGICGNPITIVRTQDVIVDLIKRGSLSVDAANAIKEDWNLNHRFTLKFDSFADLL